MDNKTEPEKIAIPSPSWALPTKSRTLREVRKIFPRARFQESTRDGIKSVELFYKIPGTKGDDAPVANVSVPPGGSVAGACLALLKAAFATLGFNAEWSPVPWPGKFVLSPIEGFVGVEGQLPIELDPDALTEAEFSRATEIREEILSGKTSRDDGIAALKALYGGAMARKNTEAARES